MQRSPLLLAVLMLPAGCKGCVEPAPGFCCLTLENCQTFDVEEVLGCEPDLVCVGNQCVAPATADAADSDASMTVDASTTIDASQAAVPSCVGLPSTCGPAGLSPCCASPLVEGGTYFRTYDVGIDGMYMDSSYSATVSSFRLDTYEVSVGRFRQFVEAGMGTQLNPPQDGAGARALNGMVGQGGWSSTWNVSLAADSSALLAALKCNTMYQTWTDTVGLNETLPITCVTWFEAMSFCIWDGGFLPTEAEWNYAAVGGDQHRAYPWSNPPTALSIDCSYANYYYNGTPHCTNPPDGGMNRVGSESPKGDGRWGQADLAGNVREWMLDWHATPYGNPCDDCSVLSPASNRVLRGGYFNDAASFMRGARRANGAPGNRFGNGIRCARAPQ